MPKLPVVKPKIVVKFLEHHGFVQTRSSGSHMRFIGPESREVTVAFHNRPLAKGTLLPILRQANLTKEDLFEYV